MEDLKLVGVHDDGEHLLLVSPNGQRFRLHADEALRAAVRRDRARLGQLQIETSGGLRPREIQSRIRAGASAEEVAEAAGVPLDHVRRYEGPVLAERQFVAQQAQAVRVRRPGGASGQVGPPADESLGTVVGERLALREVDPAAAEWDAWRSEDGTWTLNLDFSAGDRERRAQWSYDASVRHVVPLDDEARWLSEEETSAPPTPRRLATVRSVPEEEAGDSAATALLDTLALRRGRRASVGGSEPDAVREAIDSLRTSRPEAPPPETRSEEPPPRDNHERMRRHEGARRAAPDVVVLPEEPVAARAAVAEADSPAVGASARSKTVTRGRRPSVPSWDDIVFGSRRD